jgi:hypothetical protein
MASLFGFEFKRKAPIDIAPSFAPKDEGDGAVVVSAGGAFGTYIDLDGTVRTEAELITKYREMALQPEVDAAVDEIVNETMSIDEDDIVTINLDDLEVTERVKKVIRDEFQTILNLLNFQHKSYEIYRRWYIDGRLYYHTIIDDKQPKNGIAEIRYIDPRKIRKIREITKRKAVGGDAGDALIPKTQNEYFMYSDKGFNYGNKISGPTTSGLRIAKDSIVYVVSGLTDTQGTMVLSYLHKAIKALNQLRTLEDALVVYRLARAPERRIWYIDVGNLPKMKAEQYVRDIMVKHKNRLIYDGATGEVRDDRKFMCYALDTKIPLLDGRTVTLQTLMNEYEEGKQNWVYSCDPVTGKFVPGPVSWAGITKRNSEVVKVTFDNGESVICTPDHKFPVWGKGFVEAKDLIGESIIPGYRRKKSIYEGGKEYEQIFKNDTKSWEFTHREVSRWKNENGLREEILYDEKYASENKQTIHHKNCKNLDNSPSNLVLMNRYDHLKYHAEQARYNFKPNKSEDFTSEWRAKLSIKAKLRTPICKTWKITTPSGEQLIVENLNDYCRIVGLNRTNIKGKFGSKKYFAEALKNHKAISVEFLEEKIDVGCITVDLDETYHSHHTYLLDAGVYTKNTMLEDYWLPRREGGRGTEVTTLPGGQTLGEMDDVLYFQKKMYQTLNVPVNRLNSDALFSIGRATEVTRDEIKFARFVSRLRGRFCNLFTQLLEKQLVLKGVMTIEEWQQLSNLVKYNFSKDNYFTELKNAEILQGRVSLISTMDQSGILGKYYSHTWARKNVLMQDDDMIELMDEQIQEESADPLYAPIDPETGQPMVSGEEEQDEQNNSPKESKESKNEDGDKESKKRERVRQASVIIKQMKQKGAQNRSPQEEDKYRSALQVVAKNK